MVGAYKAYARSNVLGGANGAARPLPLAAGRAAVEEELPEADSLDDLKSVIYEQPLPPPPSLADAEEVMASLQEMMRLMHQQGRQAEPAYKQVYEQYKRLSVLVKQARSLTKEREQEATPC